MPRHANEADKAALLVRASALLSSGASGKAVAILSRAVRRFPGDADLLVRLGYARHRQRALEDAVTAYESALSVDPTRLDAWYGLGCAAFERGDYVVAIQHFRRALALRPKHGRTHFELGRALFAVGHVDAAVDHLRIAAKSQPGLRREALARVARFIPGSAGADNAAVLEARRAWARLEAAAQGLAAIARHRRAPHDGPLRIGYVSAFFAAANWLKPVWGVINHHDRSRIRIFLLSDGEPPDADCGYQPHRSDRLWDVRGWSNRKLAATVARSRIDVLVDLNGYSFQDRFGFLMRRPAPVIIGWFNMYATTGVEAFDYIVGDDAVIPEDEERFYSERVVRVPGSYIAFSVLYRVPEVAPPPCLAAGHVTFGSFASHYKLTGEVIAAWATILRRAPTSRLLLKNRELGAASNQEGLRESFARYGIPSERVLFEGPADHWDFLDAYARIDIALDTFPYNGGTTTTEALWQGVPVLAFNGDRWASRTSRSLLLASGLGEWCLPDLGAYIDRAVALARATQTPSELARLRSGMRGRLSAAPVCDSAALCRALETLYEAAAKHSPKEL